MIAPPAQPDAEVTELLVSLVNAGVRLAPNGPNLRCWAAAPLVPELRERIVRHKAAIVAALSAWCAARACQLEEAADGLVSELGVDARDPEIVAAAERAIGAHHTQDMAALRLAVFDLEGRARELAARRRE